MNNKVHSVKKSMLCLAIATIIAAILLSTTNPIVASASMDEGKKQTWFGVFTLDFPLGTWSEGSNNVFEVVSYPGLAEQYTNTFDFPVTPDAPLYDGYGLIRGWRIQAELPGTSTLPCSTVDAFNPAQETRLVQGWLTDWEMTRQEAVVHFNSITWEVYANGVFMGNAVFDQILPYAAFQSMNRTQLMCSYTKINATVPSASSDEGKKQYWMGIFTMDFPAGTWQEGYNTVSDITTYPGLAEPYTHTFEFYVSSEAPLYDGYGLIHGWGIQAFIPNGWSSLCNVVDSFNPAQDTREVRGWGTDWEMTRQEAVVHFQNIRWEIIGNGISMGYLVYHNIIPYTATLNLIDNSEPALFCTYTRK
jgi:hypothetical protein